jgi:hypothetical protein
MSSSSDVPLTVVDATLALLLAARIHRTAREVKATAKRCAKRLPRSKRYLMFGVVDSAQPLQLVENLAKQLDWGAASASAGATRTAQPANPVGDDDPPYSCVGKRRGNSRP